MELTASPGADRAAGARRETIVDVVVRRAREQGDALAYTFLTDGTVEAASLTYGGLDQAARGVAAGLLAVARPGDRALLVYEAGLDFVAALFGCLYAGLVAVPIPAPEASRVGASLPRLAAVAADSGARLLLGNARTHALLRDNHLDLAAIGDDGWVDTRPLAEAARAHASGNGSAPPPVAAASDPGALAYLQYTSGSTATPKGVMVGHADLVDHLDAMRRSLGYDAESVSVSWMPHFHDYGLIEGVLLPPFNGTPAYLLSPFAFLKRPADWLGAIARYRGTHTQGPNFAYRYAARRVTPAQRRGLDLASLRSAGNGAEPIHPETSEAFHAAFAECGLRREALRPVFGLAEATLLVTATAMDEAPVVGRFGAAALARGEVAAPNDAGDVVEVVGCGRPLYATHVAIVDPDTATPLGDGRVGEIWASAPGVAQGYWGRPEESEATFRARLTSGAPADAARAYLRTGDLGFLHDGQLYVTARMKDLVIIRGTNFYPQDVEWTVQRADPALRADNGAAFGVQVEGEERLCVVQELERAAYTAAELDLIAERAATAVTDAHGVALHALVLIRRGSLPKTSSGKVQRRAARQRFLDDALDPVHRWAPGGAAAPAAPPAPDPARAEAERSRREADALIGWLRAYAEQRINSRLIDERRCVPPNVVMDFGNRGVFGMQAPRQYGGLELRHADVLRVLEQLGAIDLTLATLVFLHNTNGVRPILGFAPPALRDELMPVLAAGRELAAFALSEPGAGSNLGAVDARAVPDGEGAWRLYGVKRWNGSAWAGVITVFARMVDAAGRPRGLTAFVVRQGEPGLRMGPEALTMGIRGIMQNSMTLDGVRVTRDRMLGAPGQGMRVVDAVLSQGRLSTAAIAVGAMRRCAQLLVRYASRRDIETGRLLDHPHVRARASELAHRVAVEHEQLARCAAALDAGAPLVSEVAMAAKVSATEALDFAADLLVQTLGGRGYMENNLAPQLYRDARMLRIGEGANESLVAAVGRGVRLGDAVHGYLRALDPDGTAAARLADVAARLGGRDLGGRDPGAAAGGMDAVALGAARDALLGRLAGAALGLGAARAVGRGAAGATVAWAERRFDALCGEAERFPEPDHALLAPDQLCAQVAGYADAVGDLEPLAPDVEWELDPMLRRDAGTAPTARTPSANGRPATTDRPLAPAEGPAAPTARDKRELLRHLLQREAAAGVGAAPPQPARDV